MQRRKFLIGAGSLAAAGAAAMGTGAVNYFNSERTMSVEATGDESAFIQLVPTSDYANSGGGDDEDLLELTFNEDATVGGSGLNKDADSVFRDVFKIRNRGGTSIGVWINEKDDDGDVTDSDVVEFVYGKNNSLESSGNPVSLGPGEEVSVEIQFYLLENDVDDIPDTFAVKADDSQA